MAKGFNPGGHKGKLHRELGIPEGQKIPKSRLESAEHSKNPEVARDAKRAETMEHWDHSGPKPEHHSPAILTITMHAHGHPGQTFGLGKASHGFGHGESQRSGHLRLSGNSRAHRIGKR